TLVDADIRAEADFRNEKLSLKVREAQLQKIPYMLIIGDRECENEGVTPRQRDGQNLPFMTPGGFVDLISEECRQRR
ncbi:MAG: His/Gly/Thr/Pro-type tRNA ligase C-terminal domain-containing protein, partial [Thermodesulfobacteriota bacterium]|nr:His/Gly/Thr/Pro-type tRNA ligase C-terminal domain-containing protein [Thermodesulfobacteriota bacterium]